MIVNAITKIWVITHKTTIILNYQWDCVVIQQHNTNGILHIQAIVTVLLSYTHGTLCGSWTHIITRNKSLSCMLHSKDREKELQMQIERLYSAQCNYKCEFCFHSAQWLSITGGWIPSHRREITQHLQLTHNTHDDCGNHFVDQSGPHNGTQGRRHDSN